MSCVESAAYVSDHTADRLAGAHSEVNALKEALNRGMDVFLPSIDLNVDDVAAGEWPIEPYTDINAVCDLIKSWFRVLPGGMFPPPLHMELMNAACTFLVS